MLNEVKAYFLVKDILVLPDFDIFGLLILIITLPHAIEELFNVWIHFLIYSALHDLEIRQITEALPEETSLLYRSYRLDCFLFIFGSKNFEKLRTRANVLDYFPNDLFNRIISDFLCFFLFCLLVQDNLIFFFRWFCTQLVCLLL